jgi:LCP family protein required for cell wall assembly
MKKPDAANAFERRPGRKWKLFVLWSLVGIFVVLGGVVGGYYLWLDAMVGGANDRVPDDVWEVLSAVPNVGSTPESPGAMNILVLGSDARSSTAETSRSDTIMLLHVDPANNYLSLLSFPRDLRVDLEGFDAPQKLNRAYAEGGPALTIKTIQQLTGIDIDHFLEVDFKAFRNLVEHVGGVYLEVDRRYYYTSSEYENIDLQPGYQLLGGAEALDYVRFRHDLNADFGRMERQQRLVAALRQQAAGWDLGFKLPGLVGGLVDYVATDLGTGDFIKLARWGITMDGGRIRQVTLRGINTMIDGVTLVLCTEEQIAEAVRAMLTPPGAEGAVSEVTATAGSSTTTTQAPPVLPVGATASTIPSALAWKKVATEVPFAVRAPAYVPDEYQIAMRGGTYARVYGIKVGRGERPALVMLYQHKGRGRAGEVKYGDEYINVTETTWLDAPAAGAGREAVHNGTVFTIVASAGEVERIWWKSDGVLYWVANSLSHVASEAELLAMAESMIFIPDGETP